MMWYNIIRILCFNRLGSPENPVEGCSEGEIIYFEGEGPPPPVTVPVGVECGVCRKKFENLSILNFHMKKRHPVLISHTGNGSSIAFEAAPPSPVPVPAVGGQLQSESTNEQRYDFIATANPNVYSNNISVTLTWTYLFLCRDIKLKKAPEPENRKKKGEIQCPYCPYSTILDRLFEKHLKLHSEGGTEPYICNECGWFGMNQIGLASHKKSRHGKNWSEFVLIGVIVRFSVIDLRLS